MNNFSMQRFFSVTLLLTFGTLFYVHQHIEIVKLGYSINKNQKKLTYFVDQQNTLVYNLNKLESPSMLNQRLSLKDIELVETGRKDIRYASAKSVNNDVIKNKASHRASMIEGFLDTLTAKAQAQQRR